MSNNNPTSEKSKNWRDGIKEFKCECGITLPFWGTKTDDGNMICQECKRYYTLDDTLPVSKNRKK